MVKKKKLKKDPKIKDQSNKQKNPHPSPKNDGGMNPTGVFLSIFIIAVLCTIAYLGYLWNNGKIQIGAIDYSSFASSTPTPTPTPTPEPTPTPTIHPIPLDELILDYLEEEGLDQDVISFMIEDFVDDVIYKYQEKKYFTAASTYKLPLTMIWMDRVNNGEAKLTDLLPYTYEMYEEGGPIGADYAPGEKIDLETVIRFTIQYSDNSGGHMLFEALGGWEEYKEIASRYCPVVQGDEFFSMDNVYNAEYMNYLLRRLYQNQEDYQIIIQAMKDSKPTQWLNQVIHDLTYQKYGEVEYYGHAVGFVKDGHPYSIAIYTEYGGDAPKIIGDINAICYEYFNGSLPEDLLEEEPKIEESRPVEEVSEERIEEENREETPTEG